MQKKVGERERSESFRRWFSPQKDTMANAEPEARNMQSHLGLPCGKQGPKHLNPTIANH